MEQHLKAALNLARAYCDANPVASSIVLALVLGVTLLQAYLLVIKAKYRHIAGPAEYPIIGHVPYLMKEPWVRFAEFAAKYGPVYKLWVFNKLFVVISDPELVKQVFVTRRQNYPKDAWSYKFMM